jgi:hypothetical protein
MTIFPVIGPPERGSLLKSSILVKPDPFPDIMYPGFTVKSPPIVVVPVVRVPLHCIEPPVILFVITKLSPEMDDVVVISPFPLLPGTICK